MRRDVVVLDTDVLLWWFAVDPRLSVLADEAIRKATTVLVSPITFWEVAMLVCKGRVELDRPTKQWTNDVLASPRVEQAALTPEVAVTAAELVGMDGDLADRILAATAVVVNAPLVSKDRLLRNWAAETRDAVCIW